MIPNRLPKTQSDYGKKALYLCSQAARAYEHISPHTVPPLSVVDHLEGRKPTIARNTWKQYKSALRCHFEVLLTTSHEKALEEELTAAIDRLNSLSSEGTLKYGTKTSSLKQKNFKRADYEKLIAYLTLHVGKHRYARALLIWLQATKLTGLRPSEWGSASLVAGSGTPTRLIVRNAKATNGRGNGDQRSLNCQGLAPEDLSILGAMVEMLEGYRAAGIDHTELQSKISDYMKYAARHCFGKRAKYPSLYSLRHQFSANAKASGHTRAEVAALLGHGSDATAGTHYARAVSGETGIGISPDVNDVANVRERAKTFVPRKSRDSQ